jgi:hypothetical protein
MSIGLDEESASVTIRWALEWHRLTRTALKQATEHYFHGCADVAMARSPLIAFEAMQQAQTSLIIHSAHVFAEAIMLWRRQNMDLLVMQTKHQRAPDRTRSDLTLREEKPTDEEVR